MKAQKLFLTRVDENDEADKEVKIKIHFKNYFMNFELIYYFVPRGLPSCEFVYTRL